MKHGLSGGDKQDNPLCRFHHRFSFWVGNLYEVVSAQVINFHAGFHQPAEKDGYFWGKYELLVSYRRHSSSGKLQQKKFSRGFLINVPFHLTGFDLTGGKAGEEACCTHRYACNAEYAHQAAPLMLFLFPLFSRLKYVPYRAVTHVFGTLTLAEGKEDTVVGSCSGAGCQCITGKQEANAATAHLSSEQQENGCGTPGCPDPGHTDCTAHTWPSGTKEEFVDLDLIALEREAKPAQPPVSEGERQKSYATYYNALMQHQKNITPAGKKAGNSI